jgi:hypothetical protein
MARRVELSPARALREALHREARARQHGCAGDGALRGDSRHRGLGEHDDVHVGGQPLELFRNDRVVPVPITVPQRGEGALAQARDDGHDPASLARGRFDELGSRDERCRQGCKNANR